MAKLHIVCPNCKTQYPVANQKLAGQRVNCKKCSQKFVAEIQGAAPPPEEELAPIPADDPFGSSTSASAPLGGDLFGDFPTSEPAASAPALGALPAKQKNSSSGGFAVVPMLLGAARVSVVSVVVVFAFSTLFPTAGSGQGAPRNEGAYAPPRGPGAPRGFAPPRSQADARDEPAYVPPPEDRNRPAPERPTFGQPGMPMPNRPTMNRPFDPFGRGPRPPGMPNMGPRGRNSTPDFINHLEQDYGADKLVRLEYKKISNDQAKKIGEILEPYMVAKSYTSFFDPNINSYVFMFPYDGDLNELAAKITFGEVDQVLAKERRIRLKSITLP